MSARSMHANTMLFTPGPWDVRAVVRDNAANLFNAVRYDACRNTDTEANATPTHSYGLALQLASDMNKRYHEGHRTGVPKPVLRVLP